jgi:DNA polymerase III subunit alpha
MDMPYAEVDRIAKMIPGDAEHHHRQGAGRFAAAGDPTPTMPQTQELMDTAKKLEGMVRNAGVHASAVVIAPQPLTSWCRSTGPRTTKSSPPTT